jgi:hypothetical protein
MSVNVGGRVLASPYRTTIRLAFPLPKLCVAVVAAVVERPDAVGLPAQGLCGDLSRMRSLLLPVRRVVLGEAAPVLLLRHVHRVLLVCHLRDGLLLTARPALPHDLVAEVFRQMA